MAQSLIFQFVQSPTPVSVLTIPSGFPTNNRSLMVEVNGRSARFKQTDAITLTLESAAPARSIINVWELDEPLGGYLSATATLTFPSILSLGQQEQTVSVPGAAVGDLVLIGGPGSPMVGITPTGYVSASGVVTIRMSNFTLGSLLPPASQVFKIAVVKL